MENLRCGSKNYRKVLEKQFKLVRKVTIRFDITKIPILSKLFRKIALIILNKVKKGLGLDQCKHLGEAPLSKEIIYFFQSFINIAEVYGMSGVLVPFLLRH